MVNTIHDFASNRTPTEQHDIYSFYKLTEENYLEYPCLTGVFGIVVRNINEEYFWENILETEKDYNEFVNWAIPFSAKQK